MSYTVKINSLENELAKKLLLYLISLSKSKEYDFLQITEDKDVNTEKTVEEIKKENSENLNYFLQHQDQYPNWDEIKLRFDKDGIFY